MKVLINNTSADELVDDIVYKVIASSEMKDGEETISVTVSIFEEHLELSVSRIGSGGVYQDTKTKKESFAKLADRILEG